MIHPNNPNTQAKPDAQPPQKPGKRPRRFTTAQKVIVALLTLIILVVGGFLILENGHSPSSTPGSTANNSNIVTPALTKPWCAAPNALANTFYGTSISSVSPSDVWSVGTQVMHWDGSAWKPSYTPSSQEDALRSIVEITPADVWVVGEQQGKGLASHPLAIHWDGSQWQTVSVPDSAAGGKNALVAVAATAPDDVWAVGFTVPLQGPIAPLIEHWNGTKWSVTHLSVSLSLQFTSVKALTASDAWAVGYEYGTRNGKNFVQPVTEHWNGTQWSSVANPDLSASGGGSLYSINGDSASDLWAVGSANNGSAMLTERWDGSKWSLVPSPAVQPSNSNWLAGVAVNGPNDVWSVGRVGDSQSGFQPFIEHWNGQQWQVLQDPTGNAGELDSISIVGQQIWIVGLPRTTGGHAFIETICPSEN